MSEAPGFISSLPSGEPQSAEELLPLVYEELRRLAGARMAMEKGGQTLQPTALVHEVWLRLAGENHPWANQRQFFSAAAEAMRRILIERARERGRIRHGGGLQRAPIEELDLAVTASDDLLHLVNESLERLAQHDPTSAELIRLRFYVGLSNVQAAQVLGLSERSAKRAWAYARAWLFESLQRQA